MAAPHPPLSVRATGAPKIRIWPRGVPSAFYQHFKAATSLSPLQFQKQLRLIEARRMMLAGGRSASSAAFEVGYESAPQFTREYRRMFGLPPAREVDAARRRVQAA